MGAALFTDYRENMLDSSAPDLFGTTIAAYLVEMTGTGEGQLIESSIPGPNIQITITAHGIPDGTRVAIQDHATNTNANGTFITAAAAANTFELTNDTDGGATTGNGSGGATGSVVRLDQLVVSEISGLEAGPINLSTKDITGGVFDAADVTFGSVAAGPAISAILIAENTGMTVNDDLLVWLGSDTVTGLPVTPNGGDITVTWDTAGIFTLGATAP